MATLYPRDIGGRIEYRSFTGNIEFEWWQLRRDPAVGDLLDGHLIAINYDVTREQAERSLRQMGHKVGEWDG